MDLGSRVPTPLSGRTRRLVVAALATWLAASTATAADTSPPPRSRYSEPASPDAQLTNARALIAARRWVAAIDELRRLNQVDNADWNNLMGYALRKQPVPDLAAAERHYDAALRLNPSHRGALEYSGELYLMKGDLPAAERQLERLSSVCASSCAEYLDLKAAVARHKAGVPAASGPT